MSSGLRILFVHKNFPAQFGHLARRLVERHGCECWHVAEGKRGVADGVILVPYGVEPVAETSHSLSRTFESGVRHAHAVLAAVKRADIPTPDLIVGHSGFGSTLFLGDALDRPVVNYFEWYYDVNGPDVAFRPGRVVTDADRMRARTRNAMIQLDLENCTVGTSPTVWQRGLLPSAYADKVGVRPDGLDTELWNADAGPDAIVGARDVRVVTYVARTFEPVRGFDVFVRVAARIAAARDDVVFVCVGDPAHGGYGTRKRGVDGAAWLDQVFTESDAPRDRFLFPGRIPSDALARLLARSDLHVYLTEPFIPSWSLLNAMACGAVVLASDVAPVRELVTDEEDGRLRDFFDDDALARAALEVLDDPAAYASLGRRAAERVRARHALDVVAPDTLEFYATIADGSAKAPRP